MVRQTSQTLSIGFIGLSNLLMLFTGLAIQVVTSALFGAGHELDAFLVAVTVPNLLYLMINASFGNAFIPLFLRQKQQMGELETWRRFSPVLNTTLLILLLITALGILYSRQIVTLVAPSLSESSLSLASNLAKVTFPLLIGSTIVSVGTGIFQAHSRFTLPALAPITQKLVKIAVLIGLSSIVGIWGLAVAETFAWMVAAILILIGLYQLRLPYQYQTLRGGDWSLIFSVGGFSLAAILIQFFALIDRFVASGLPEGSISYLFYGQTISIFIRAIIAESAMTVLLPVFAIRLAKEEVTELKKTISRAVRVIGFAVIPTIVIVAILRSPLIQLLAQRGKFTANDTKMVAQVLLAYSGVIFAPVFGSVFVRVLYALKAVRFVVAVSAFLLTLYLPLCFLLAPTLGIAGIALTYSLVLNVNWIIMAIYLQRRLGSFGMSAIARSLLISALSALAMGAVVAAVFNAATGRLGASEVGRLAMSVMVAGIVGVVTYFGIAALLGREELSIIRQRAFDVLKLVRETSGTEPKG